MSLGRAEMACFVHIIYTLYSSEWLCGRENSLVYAVAEGAKGTSGMGRLTLHQTVSLVVILHLLAHCTLFD